MPVRFRLPALACDAHCHVFGPVDRFPYARERAYTPPEAPKEQLAAMQRSMGIDRAVVVQPTCHGADNAVTLDAIAASGGRYRGVAIVDDTFDEAQLRALHEGGIRGARFSFIKKLGGAPEIGVVRRVVDRIRGFGWHLVLLVDAADLGELRDMLVSLPIPFVIDHMGRARASDGPKQPAFDALLDLLDHEHAWVKIAGIERTSADGPPYSDAMPFASALVRKAPERVIWGTDWPHPNLAQLPDDADLVDAIAEFAPDAVLQERLLVTNPARLYGFTGEETR